jgi:hypothetical protein
MAGNTLVTMLGRASAWIRDHLLASYLVTAACILLMADAIRRVLPDDSHTGAITWVAIGLMAYAGVAMLIFVKRFPDNRGIFVAWGMAHLPPSMGSLRGCPDPRPLSCGWEWPGPSSWSPSSRFHPDGGRKLEPTAPRPYRRTMGRLLADPKSSS